MAIISQQGIHKPETFQGFEDMVRVLLLQAHRDWLHMLYMGIARKKYISV